MPDSTSEILEDWPNAKNFGPSVAHLHALGAISLQFNKLEHMLSYTFYEYIGIDRELSDAIFFRLNNNHRLEVIKLLIKKRCETDFAELLIYGITCFDVCAENRNTLAHLIHVEGSSPEWLGGRKKNSAKTDDLLFLMDVRELRSVADGIKATYDFIMALSLYRFRQWHEKHHPDETLFRDAGPNTLREKPRRPDKLSPLQIRKDPKT